MDHIFGTFDRHNSRWVDPIHKTRWVEICIRYDDFLRFLNDFLIPYTTDLMQNKIVSSFYYHVVPEGDSIIQLHLQTSQYKFKRYICEDLFTTLNKYFAPGFLASFGVRQIDIGTLEKKNGFKAFNWNNFSLIGIEEFSLNCFPFVRSTYGKEEICQLLCQSSSQILNQFYDLKTRHELLKISQLSFKYLCPLLNTFLNDKEEAYQFCQWISDKTLNTLSVSPYFADQRNNNCVDPGDGRNPQRVLSQLSYNKHPQNNGNSLWQMHVKEFKSKLDALEAKELLHIWELGNDDSKIPTHIRAQNNTGWKWRLLHYLAETIQCQLGMSLPLRYHQYLSMRELSRISYPPFL